MIVKCVRDTLTDVPERYRQYAVTQDDDGNLDIAIGKHYIVYAMSNGSGQDYFVHTDNDYAFGMLWMPAELYEIVDDRRPEGWVERRDGSEVTAGFPSLFDGTTGWLIPDNDEDAVGRYLAEAASDPTFPTDAQLEQHNRGFYREQRIAAYREAVRMAEERGWEWPEKPDDLDDE